MRVLISSVLFIASLAVSQCHVRVEELPPNRCLPGQGCFPNRQELREFQATLVGRVVMPSDAEYSGLVRNKNTRATRHPALIVLAGDVSDVQKAMLFARKFQLMVTSQAGNDEPSGRSTYDGSLNINLSQLTAISTLNENTTRSEYGEITSQAGAVWEDLYRAARVYNRDIVAPNALKSAVGGTVGDGGVGPLVRIYGLVSDNLLEAQIVLADGSLVTVTDYQITQDFGEGLVRKSFDRSLLAAISGGGVGPWGVVVSYTFKMQPAPAGIVRFRLQYTLWEAGDYVGAEVMEKVNDALFAMPAKWGGYVYISGLTSDATPDSKGGLVVNLFYYGTLRQDSDYDFIDTFLSIDGSASLVSSRGPTNESGVLEFEQNQPNILYNPQDVRFYGFNTLLQLSDPPMENQSQKFTEVLLFALNNPTIESTYFCSGQIMGMAAENKPRYLDLVNPALRSAYASLSCQLVFPGRGLDDSFYVAHAMDFRKLLAPFGHGKVRYWAEPDVVDWKKEFHGESYGQLIETKLRYDIDNYLWCHNCVGSDFRVKGCNQRNKEQDAKMAGGHSFLLKGNKFGGYISDARFRATKLRQEMSSDHKARLVYISQMTVDRD